MNLPVVNTLKSCTAHATLNPKSSVVAGAAGYGQNKNPVVIILTDIVIKKWVVTFPSQFSFWLKQLKIMMMWHLLEFVRHVNAASVVGPSVSAAPQYLIRKLSRHTFCFHQKIATLSNLAILLRHHFNNIPINCAALVVAYSTLKDKFNQKCKFSHDGLTVTVANVKSGEVSLSVKHFFDWKAAVQHSPKRLK